MMLDWPFGFALGLLAKLGSSALAALSDVVTPILPG